MNLEAHMDLGPWQNEMSKRKIPKLTGEEILQWGYLPQVTYSTQESYQVKTQLDPPPTRKIWSKIWNLKHCTKITLFLWLVSHSSILTWDNLSKRGFIGPSICMLCGEGYKTMNHLLNSIPYTAQIWDQVVLIIRI
jgi:hypothetical protein